MVIKSTVVSSVTLDEFLGKIKRNDPMLGHIYQVEVNHEEMYNVSSDDLKRVPVMPGDRVSFHSEMGGGRLGFASDS